MSARASFVQRGGTWVLAQFILMSAVFVLAGVLRGPAEGVWHWWAGGVLLALSAVFGLAGVAALGRGTTPLLKPGRDARLVQTGIYARVRHPLYTSVVLASLGWAVLWRSWPAGLAALVLVAFLRAKARREEQWLREAFPDYADYARRVPGFLPRLPRGH